MLPPCDPAILDNNPQFKKLYTNLTTTLLNPDGSTRATEAQPARRETNEELKNLRIQDAKRQIKKHTLRQLAFDPDSGLHDDHRDLLAIITLYLDSSPTQLNDSTSSPDAADDALSLLAPDINTFYTDLLPVLTPAFSKALSTTMRDLRDLTNLKDKHNNATQEPSTRQQSSSRARNRQSLIRAAAQTPLAAILCERIRRLRQAQLAEMPGARVRMATMAAAVMSSKAAVLERAVVLLERTKHGAVARATKARAEHLMTVAEGVDGKLNVMKLDVAATIYTPETVAAIGRYYEHLRDVKAGLEGRQAQLMKELDGYEAVESESGPMKEIARRYGGLIKEIEEVRAEIERLEG